MQGILQCTYLYHVDDSAEQGDTLPLPEPADPQSQQVANDSFAPVRLIRQSGRDARHSDMPEDKPRWNPSPSARLTKQDSIEAGKREGKRRAIKGGGGILGLYGEFNARRACCWNAEDEENAEVHRGLRARNDLLAKETEQHTGEDRGSNRDGRRRRRRND